MQEQWVKIPIRFLKGWEGYSWKDGEYIDSIQEFFDEKINNLTAVPVLAEPIPVVDGAPSSGKGCREARESTNPIALGDHESVALPNSDSRGGGQNISPSDTSEQSAATPGLVDYCPDGCRRTISFDIWRQIQPRRLRPMIAFIYQANP